MQFTSPSGDCVLLNPKVTKLEFLVTRLNSKHFSLLDMLARLYEAVFIRNDLNLNQMLESVLLMMLSLSRSVFFYLSQKR